MSLSVGMITDAMAAQSVAPKLDKLKKSSQAMEAHFLKDMLEAMRKSVDEGKSGDSFGSDQYKDMFDDAVSNAMSQKSHLGIAETVFKSLEPAAFNGERKSVAEKSAAKLRGSKVGNS